MTDNMAQGSRPGPMDPAFQVSSPWECVTVPEYSAGPMGPSFPGPSSITKLKGKESTYGVTVEAIKAVSKQGLWMAKVSTSGQMAGYTQDSMYRTKNMGMEYLRGPTGEYMMDTGKKAKWKALAHTQHKMEPGGKVSGGKIEPCSGLMMKSTDVINIKKCKINVKIFAKFSQNDLIIVIHDLFNFKIEIYLIKFVTHII